MDEAGRAVTLGCLLVEARDRLQSASVTEAALDARLLVEHFTGTTRTEALAAPGKVVPADKVEAVRRAVERRLEGEPVHRILGYREFYGMPLRLSPGTLEPRPDTETLVDLVLPFARRVIEARGECRILDLGTGTGAIALALLGQLPAAHAVATDISSDALVTAGTNADIVGYGERFEPIQSDWFAKVNGRFHVIVSNPPYIATAVWNDLAREVRDFDPRAALDGGPDGLDAYRIIAAQAERHLVDGGIVGVEIGYDQRKAVTTLFAGHGYAELAHGRDLGGHGRALIFGRAEDVHSA